MHTEYPSYTHADACVCTFFQTDTEQVISLLRYDDERATFPYMFRRLPN